MIGAMVRIAVTHVGLVIAPTGAEVADAAGLAVRSTAIGGALEKRAQPFRGDAVLGVPEGRELRAGKPVTEIQSPWWSTASKPTPAPHGNALRRPSCRSVIN